MTEHATYRELRRSRSDRLVAGVCGGLGRYFDVNPTFYRVGFVVLTLLGGAGLLIYGAALLVMPDEGSNESIIEEALRDHRDRPARLLGIGIVAVAAIMLLANARLWPHGDAAWLLLLLAGLALLASRRGFRRRATPGTALESVVAPAGGRRSFSLTLGALGLLVITAGILGALASWGVDVPWAVALAVAAVTVGVALVAGAALRLRVGGLVVIGLVLAVAAVLASTIDVHLNDGLGNRSYAPATVRALKHDYRLGIGNLQIDLSQVALPPGSTRVEAHLGIGELQVTVPANATVRVESHVGWGDSHVLGQDENGHGVDATVIRPARSSDATIVLEAHLGAGQIEVTRAPA